MRLFSILGALALTLIRYNPFYSHYIGVLTEALRFPALRQDVLVQAALSSPYTSGPLLVAHLNAWLGLPSDAFVCGLNLLLWTVQAALMFRLAKLVTGSPLAAAIATLLCGLNMPICLSDAPYYLEKPERALAMAPLLWSLICVLEGRRWAALLALAAATYLHGDPAIYLWPLVAVEDALEAWRRPDKRPAAFARLAATAALALPLLLSVSRHPLPAEAADYTRLSLLIHTMWTKLTDIPSRWLFIIEGMILTFMAAWRLRHRPAVPTLLRGAALCYVMLAATFVASRLYVPGAGGFPLWGVIVRMQLGVSLFIFDLFGQILLAGWLAREIEEGSGLWPAFLATLVSWNSMYDGLLRGVGIGLGFCMLAGAERPGRRLTLAAAAVALSFALAPEAFLAAARALRLSGGLFSFSIFQPATAAALLACAAAGYALKEKKALALPACAGLLLCVSLTRWWPPMTYCDQRCRDTRAISEWARLNTPQDAVLMPSPVDLVDLGVIALSRRSLFVCSDYLENAVMFGKQAAPMGRRLQAMGLRLDKIHVISDLAPQLKSAEESLTPELARQAAGADAARSYLLLPASRSWPIPPVHRCGSLALYPVSGAGR